MICAMIDVGSNTIRLSIYRCEKGTIKVLVSKKIMAGLAGYVVDGSLSDDGVKRAVKALLAFREILENFEIKTYFVFATASLRNVANSEEVVKTIEKKTGFSIDLISGEEEAELGFLGATYQAPLVDGILVDIGGGSTELCFCREGKPVRALSLPVGSLTLYNRCVSGLLPSEKEKRQIAAIVEEELRRREVLPEKFPAIVGIGGSIRATGAMNRDFFGLPREERRMPAGNVKKLLKLLKGRDKEACQKILQRAPERIHTLIPGMVVLSTIVRYFSVQEITVSALGVREGYLLKKVLKEETADGGVSS